MIHAVVLAAAVGARRGWPFCSAPVAVARIHLVEGMPFVAALRPTLRARMGKDIARTGAHAFVLYDGSHPLAKVSFALDGTVIVIGYVRSAENGAAVDVVTQTPGKACANRLTRIDLKPS